MAPRRKGTRWERDQVETVDQYIASFPEDVQVVLQGVRAALHRALPEAGEKISYKIPTLTLDGRYVVYFAGWKHHVSLYPVPAGDAQFQEEIAPFRVSTGTVHFPLGQPVPYDLIERMAEHLGRELTAARD